jgi:hypothetical protein
LIRDRLKADTSLAVIASGAKQSGAARAAPMDRVVAPLLATTILMQSALL